MNRIVGLRSLEDLEKAYDWMHAKNGRKYLQIDDASVSGEGQEWILKRGLVDHGGWVKLRREAPCIALVTSSAVTTRKASHEDADLVAGMMCEGFGFPENLRTLWSSIVGRDGWTCLVAELDGEAIGTGALFVSNGYGWLGGGTTLPAFRGPGAQAAIINGRIAEGLKQGASVFVVETEQPVWGKSNTSFKNLTRAGFRQFFTRKNYRLPDQAH
ncbi:N-acetyltransferase [Rhizobium leguminosarum]|uniref:N-acetyltransferase n=1 Tax=Rhizobium leguminosarum TaxID=384 RepID=UPI0021BBBB33|nr:N-acetyltransferase [Rhizobium leguminosarum]